MNTAPGRREGGRRCAPLPTEAIGRWGEHLLRGIACLADGFVIEHPKLAIQRMPVTLLTLSGNTAPPSRHLLINVMSTAGTRADQSQRCRAQQGR